MECHIAFTPFCIDLQGLGALGCQFWVRYERHPWFWQAIWRCWLSEAWAVNRMEAECL